MDRRRFVVGGSGALLGLWLPRPGHVLGRGGLQLPAHLHRRPEGTTLEATVSLPAGPGYTRLGEGPGWPTVVRDDLAPARRGRHQRRRALAAIVHLTDIHVIDAQSPGRVEFLDPFGDPLTAAYRPQEAFTLHVAASMVQRIDELRRAPVSGRRFDCALSTGDNIDNQQLNEARWFTGVLDGGRLAANSGSPDVYEGVQQAEAAHPRYWHPDEGRHRQLEDRPGLPVDPRPAGGGHRAVRRAGAADPVVLDLRHHDGLIQGVLPSTAASGSWSTAGR